MIVSGSWDRTIRIWNAITCECIKVLKGHFKEIWSVSLYDTMIISGSGDKTIRIWDATTGNCINVIKGHTDFVWSVSA